MDSDLEKEPSSKEPLISLHGVGVSYFLWRNWRQRKRHWALRNVSFDLHRGESLGVIGRNGSGKSTLLRLIAGVIGPDEGIIHNRGVRSSLLSLRLGFVDYLTGRENAVLGAMFMGMKRKEILRRMDEIIAFSELGDFIDVPVKTYSSGMKARLAFAVAFQVDPDVLLIDEVAGVGDERFKERSFSAMKERMKSEESTVVFVSHIPSHIAQLCDRAIWIEKGEIRAHGEVLQVLKAYKNFSLEQPYG